MPPPSHSCAPSWSRGTSSWSRPPGLPAWSDWPPLCWPTGRQRLASGQRRWDAREVRPRCRPDLVVAVHRRHAGRHPGAAPPRIRPGDPRRRADVAPHQARYADDGGHGHHRGHPGGLRRRPRGEPGSWSRPTASALLVLFLMTGLGLVGFLDDYIKIVKQRSLGLKSRAKLAGQSVVSIAFAVLALGFRNHSGLTPASRTVSFVRDSN